MPSPSPASRASTSAVAELIVEHLAGARELGLDRRVDLAVARTQHGAAAGDAAVGLRLEAAAELLGQRAERGAHDVEVVGVHEHRHALAVHQAAQRALHVVEDELGRGGERRTHDLLGDAQRELDGRTLGAVGQRVAVGGQRGRGGAQRVLIGGDLRDALGEAGGVTLGEALRASDLERAVDLLGRRDADRRAQLRARGRGLELVEGVRVGAHTTSSSPRARVIWPASSRRRTAATIELCASSTAALGCGPIASMSSRTTSAARADRFAMSLSRTASSTPRIASARSFWSISRSTSWTSRSGSSTMSSKVKSSWRTSSARSACVRSIAVSTLRSVERPALLSSAARASTPPVSVRSVESTLASLLRRPSSSSRMTSGLASAIVAMRSETSVCTSGGSDESTRAPSV